MGYVRHHAIVVTSWDDGHIDVAAEEATRIGLQVIGPSDAAINGYRSMLVCPDGSKEGWAESNKGDIKRAAFCKWLDKHRYNDGSTCLEWVEVSYGSDDQDAAIERHAWTTLVRSIDDDATPEGWV
jgi:hypothetical protein